VEIGEDSKVRHGYNLRKARLSWSWQWWYCFWWYYATVYIGEKEHTLTNADGAVTKITEGSTDVITFGY